MTPNPSLQGTLRIKPRKAPELERWASRSMNVVKLSIAGMACVAIPFLSTTAAFGDDLASHLPPPVVINGDPKGFGHIAGIVYFSERSDAITADADAKLRTALSDIREFAMFGNQPVCNLVAIVVGHTSATEYRTQAARNSLARRRAQALRQWFERNGSPAFHWELEARESPDYWQGNEQRSVEYEFINTWEDQPSCQARKERLDRQSNSRVGTPNPPLQGTRRHAARP